MRASMCGGHKVPRDQMYLCECIPPCWKHHKPVRTTSAFLNQLVKQDVS